MHQLNIAIIGGGVIGLFIARELKKKFPNKEIVLFEKASRVGEYNTTHNSGVLHSGIYYEYGSNKHRFCLEGNEIWYSLCKTHNITVQNCGKLIVASDIGQYEGLEKLLLKGKKNKVPKLSLVSKCPDKLNNYLHFKKAIHCSTTGVLDVSSALNWLQADVTNKGVIIQLNNEVSSISYDQTKEIFSLKDNYESYHFEQVINCAGLNAIDLREQLGLNDLKNQYVRGNYLKYSGIFPKEALIYPLPRKKLKGLGVHLTFNSAGEIYFGPDTEDIKEIDFNNQKADSLKPKFIASINKLFKNIDQNKLFYDYSGIRPKITSNTGELIQDFWIKAHNTKGLKNYIELCGIESPGLTAAPAIGRYISTLL
jgi:L-2-hydroxyglutarate oxidase LhgO